MKKILAIIFAIALSGCGGGASTGGNNQPTVGATTTTSSSAHTTTTTTSVTTTTAGTGTTTTTANATTTTSSVAGTTTTAAGTTSTTDTGTTTTTVSATTTTTTPVGTGASSATTQIISIHSGKCLDVTGGPSATGNGVPIEQWTCAGPAATNQAWTVKDIGNAQYEIIAANSGKCLDIANSSTASGTPVQQMNCTGQPNQLWKLLGTDVRQFQLISALLPHSGQNCLSIASNNGAQQTNDGASIVSASCDYEGSADNSWAMDVALPIVYRSNLNECLDVRGGDEGTADGTPVEIWTCAGSKNQLWTAKDKGNHHYQFVVSNSGKCLDLDGGTAEDSKAKIAQCADTPTQLWSSDNEGLGHRSLISVAPNGDWYCLDIVGGYSAVADGVLTAVTKCTGQQYGWVIGVAAPFP